MARAAPAAMMRARIVLAVWMASCAAPPGALAADPEVARLLERAQLWQTRARDDLAREDLAKALRLTPDDPEALAMLARVQLRANQDRDAAATVERLRKAHPDHPEGGRLATLLRIRGADKEKLRHARQLARAGRSDEAVQAYRALFPDGFPDDELALEHARALAATRSGREAGAKVIAELARKNPADPIYQVAWAADMSTRKPVAPSTLRSLRDLAAVPGVARQAIEAWRLALLGMDATEESAAAVREYLAAYPGDTALREKLGQLTQAVAAARRLRDDPGYRARREGVEAIEAGRLDEAEPLLERAISLHPDDGEAVGALGLLRLRQGRHAQALDLFQRARRLAPRERLRWTSLERTARYWGLLQQAAAARAAGAFDEAQARVREAIAIDPAEPAAQAELARIQLAIKSVHAGRLRDSAKELHAQERITEAIAALEEGLAHEPGNPWLVHDLARLYAARGEPARGEALFAQLRRRDPDDADVRYAMALFLSSIDREAVALALMDGIAAAKRSEGMTRLQRRLWVSMQGREAAALAKRGQVAESERIVASMRDAVGADIDVALEVARSFDRMEKDAEVRAVLDRVAALGGATTEHKEAIAELERSLVRRESAALAQASEIARREGDIDRAVAYEQRALALEPSDEGWRLRRLASLRDQQLGWLGAGVDALHRSGSAGKSRMEAQEMSFGYREPWRRGGRAFFRVAAARVASGAVDLANEPEAATFGSVLACQPLCSGQLPAWTQTGVALAAGTQFDNLRLDIGASPVGFPVVNLVGGAFYKGEFRAFSYSIDASRRPLESTLLSYAGSRDPNTGRTWGGVVTTGVRLNVSRDSGGDYGAWSLAGLYRLSGRNVKDNDKAELMAGAYRRLVNEEHRQLAAGVTTMLWCFSENAGEFTFGHGGYYSPKTYASLALPVTFAMRSASTSLYARASVSVSWSESRRAPFFPTDGDLQAHAETLASANGRDPFYAGGSNGRGYGRSFAAAAEHRLAPNLFVGARLELERSTHYTPNRLLIYIRMSPGGAAAGPIAMPPEPIVLPGFQY